MFPRSKFLIAPSTWNSCVHTVLVRIFSVVFLALSPAASAVVSFDLQLDDGLRTVSVDEVQRAGQSYVPLVDILQAIGATNNLLTTRMSIDFRGARTWIQMGDKRVIGGQVFNLTYPVLRDGDAVLIARADVAPFFRSAFGIAADESALEQLDPVAEGPRSVTIASGGRVVSRGSSPSAVTPVVLAPPKPETRPIHVITIDPAHGGQDAGAEAPLASAEKTITLALAKTLAAGLADIPNVTVKLLREEDTGVSDPQRGVLAASYETDLLISLHAAAAMSPEFSGAAVYCPPPRQPERPYRSQVLAAHRSKQDSPDYSAQARNIAEAVGRALADSGAISLRAVSTVPCKIFEFVRVPAIVIEAGCMTNPANAATLADAAARDAIAHAIAKGVRDYLAVPAQEAARIDAVEPLKEIEP